MDYFWGQGWLVAGIIIFFLLSICCQLLAGLFLLQLLKESKELEEGSPRLLRSWLEQYLKEENQISNTSAFVEKGLLEFKIGKFNLFQLKHMAGQLLLFSVFLSGLGACKGIVEGKTLGQILPFYIICLLGLYIHFSLSGIIDIEEKKQIIRTNLLDFLENHKPYLWGNSCLETEENKDIEKEVAFGEKEEEQLKELLKEILA